MEPPSPPPTPPLEIITEHQAGFPVLYSNFSPAIHFRPTQHFPPVKKKKKEKKEMAT